MLRDGWRPLTFDGIAPTRFLAERPNVIRIRSNRSSSLIYRMISGEDRGKSHLTWRWRVDKTIAPTNLMVRGRDDRALALHVVFAEASKTTGILDRLNRLAGVGPLGGGGKVLTYVWGGLKGRGAAFPNPYFQGRGVIVILRPGAGPAGRWMREKVDLARDYRRAFGGKPPAVAYIAVSGDTDDTRRMSEGRIADISFSAR